MMATPSAATTEWTVHSPVDASRNPIWFVISDDLTGLQAIGGEFARVGFRVGTAIARLPSVRDVQAFEVFGYDTATRSLDAHEAEKRVENAMRHLVEIGASRIFKHNDSIMQGNVGAELRAVARLRGKRPVLFCPACPNRGRVTVAGVHKEVDREGRDVPGGMRIDVRSHIGARLAVSILGLDVLRRGEAARFLAAATEEIIVADACTDEDLDLLADASEHASCDVLAGSVGLAAAIARAAVSRHRQVNPVLIVAGSLQRATRDQTARLLERADCEGVELSIEGSLDEAVRQADEALRSGKHCVVWSGVVEGATSGSAAYPALPEPMLTRLRVQLLSFVRSVAIDSRAPLAGVILAGGATADLALRDALGVTRLSSLGWMCEGVTMALALDGHRPGLPIITKSGGWGPSDALCDAVDRLIAWRCTQPLPNFLDRTSTP